MCVCVYVCEGVCTVFIEDFIAERLCELLYVQLEGNQLCPCGYGFVCAPVCIPTCVCVCSGAGVCVGA